MGNQDKREDSAHRISFDAQQHPKGALVNKLQSSGGSPSTLPVPAMLAVPRDSEWLGA